LIGRDHELDSLSRLIDTGEHRLITLVGPGGVGKTRVAMAITALSHFADGIRVVDLSALRDSDLVAPLTAAALGVRLLQGESPTDAIRRTLSNRHLLLVLDNFEHVLPAASFVADLHAHCPTVQILVTSRRPLLLQDERLWPLMPLAVPDRSVQPTRQQLEQVDSARLFKLRAQQVRPDFDVTDDNADAIAKLCRHLDGLPLALELAAARVSLLSPTAMVERLDQRLTWLNNGARDRPGRQRTMRSTIAWSHDLLAPSEQVLLRRLAVFSGSWTLDAVLAIAEDSSPTVLSDLTSLLDLNLIYTVTVHGDQRFGMLETIREYALELLEASEECDVVHLRHADYFGEIASTASRHLAESPETDSISRLTRDENNIRSALVWLRDHGLYARGLRLAAAMGAFWRLKSSSSEGCEWLETFLTHTSDAEVDLDVQIAALRWAGELAGLKGEHELALQLLGQSLDMSRRAKNPEGAAASLAATASVYVQHGDIERSIPFFEEGADIARQLRHQRLAAFLTAYLAFAVGSQGHFGRARALFDESETHLRMLGDGMSFESCFTQLGKGWLALALGETLRADRIFRLADSMGRALDAKAVLSAVLAGEGELSLLNGDSVGAVSRYREGLALGWDGQFNPGVIWNTAGLVCAAYVQGEVCRAARFTGFLHESAHVLRSLPHPASDRYRTTLTNVQTSLSREEYCDQYERGRELSVPSLLKDVDRLITMRKAFQNH
jgi:predicted ATPase